MDIQHDQPAAATPYGLKHYGFEGIQSSSADRGWSGLSAQLCGVVRKGVIPWRTPQSDIRICVDTRGNDSLVTRRAPGVESRIIARRGTVWLSPPGLQEGAVDIAEDLTGILHIYLPVRHFSPSNFDINVDLVAVSTLSYERALEDPLLAEIGFAIASELRSETSTGGLLVGSLASSLAARLIQKYVTASSAQAFPRHTSQGLDRRRLQRVLDYIEANLEGDLNLDLMASIACLSRYHFARAFKQAIGQPPHRYVSARRLDRAKALLMRGDRSLVDIALALSFSDQASFTRAFRQATGQAPGRYRHEFGSRRHGSSPADIGQALSMLA
ncbi:helix-turn-helix domain-containing protein [Bradyrhizobium ivorense]|uniref:helix-turn-helix domain-containing protein n=1 Tax=Bradyrhizobium ivorense TaxID=2511166 RepID=UPI001FCE8570|nr:AraC family transcriptional regulator [Bradyrhizobium ivorense]